MLIVLCVSEEEDIDWFSWYGSGEGEGEVEIKVIMPKGQILAVDKYEPDKVLWQHLVCVM